ncbi:MAG: phosphoethanolamine--lipid A transferase [Zoogloeaceae bacterium]|jgi:lipid A ethanolaminephosphotransferase|nr:phosphoethanolamine--lipid A transferase [Zoogloeaceae bacterium]
MFLQKSSRRPVLSSGTVVFMLSLYFTVVLNATLWHFLQGNLPFDRFSSVLLWAWFPLFIFLLQTVIFNALCWPYLTKPLGAFLLVGGGIATSMMLRYGILIDASTFRNIFETNTREALDYVNLANILWPTLIGIVPAILLCGIRIQYARPVRESVRHLLLIVASLVAFAAIAGLAYKDVASFGRNHREMPKMIVPYNYLQGMIRYGQKVRDADKPFQLIDPSPKLTAQAAQNPQRTILILAIGESSRAMNYSLDGYARNTNPELSKEDVVSFQQVLSDGTYTALAVPSIFSHLTRKQFRIDEAARTENLLDLAQKAGYEVLWVDNDDGCKGVCKRVPTIIAHSARHCQESYCYDEVLLDGLEDKIRNGKKNMLVVLHLLGSHGPSYFLRYPEGFGKFQPACNTNEIRGCSQAQIENTYDNTILYTDHVLDDAIGLLKQFPEAKTGFLYVSDHGESLGENGMYLHGLPYALAPIEQKHVPMVLWMNAAMKKEDRIDYACLKQKAHAPLNQDYIFHTVVHWLDIDTVVYDPNYDFLTPCKKP